MKHVMSIRQRDVDDVAKIIVKSFNQGNKLMVAGNGGSSCDAQHFVGELVCTYKDRHRDGLPAICLNSDMAVITAWSNDWDYSEVFSRQVKALGFKGDVFIGISTSGKSRNILQAMDRALDIGMEAIMLTGKNVDSEGHYAIRFNATETPRIQEYTIFFIHEVCGKIEEMMKKC